MKIFLVLLFIFACGCVWAQDYDFGFEDDLAPPEDLNPTTFVKVGGDVSAELSPYIRSFYIREEDQEITLWDILSGRFYLSAGVSFIEAYTKINLNYDSVVELWDKSPKLKKDFTYTPQIIDEAYLKAFIGSVNVEAGFRKLAWGKADNPGPLDITNPMDYSDLRNITDVKAIKIARPMLHITWNAGSFSKLEGVFIPNFSGHRYADDGRWQPSQVKNMPSTVEGGITSLATNKFAPILANNPSYIPVFYSMLSNNLSSFNGTSPEPSTGSIEYFQAGLRYTTTIGSVDIGGQYFYGYLFRPSFTIAGIDAYLDDLAYGIFGAYPPNLSYQSNLTISPEIKYNRYHQIGIDYAQVLLGFNIRAELAFHLTEDLSGDDGSVQNPFIGWSVGFDRDLFWSINLNIQCNETVRLFNGKIGDNPILDAEAGTNAVSTRLTSRLTKSFLMDKLESSATVIWDIENMDCYIIPALVWTEDSLSCNLSAGIFLGKETGDFGQYWKNNYIKLGLKYSFKGYTKTFD